MPAIEVFIHPRNTYSFKEWEFTGRIKYEKYANRTKVYFEIIYPNHYYKRGFLFNTRVEFNATKWLPETLFILQEIPDVEIYDCS